MSQLVFMERREFRLHWRNNEQCSLYYHFTVLYHL